MRKKNFRRIIWFLTIIALLSPGYSYAEQSSHKPEKTCLSPSISLTLYNFKTAVSNFITIYDGKLTPPVKLTPPRELTPPMGEHFWRSEADALQAAKDLSGVLDATKDSHFAFSTMPIPVNCFYRSFENTGFIIWVRPNGDTEKKFTEFDGKVIGTILCFITRTNNGELILVLNEVQPIREVWRLNAKAKNLIRNWHKVAYKNIERRAHALGIYNIAKVSAEQIQSFPEVKDRIKKKPSFVSVLKKFYGRPSLSHKRKNLKILLFKKQSFATINLWHRKLSPTDYHDEIKPLRNAKENLSFSDAWEKLNPKTAKQVTSAYWYRGRIVSVSFEKLVDMLLNRHQWKFTSAKEKQAARRLTSLGAIEFHKEANRIIAEYAHLTDGSGNPRNLNELLEQMTYNADNFWQHINNYFMLEAQLRSQLKYTKNKDWEKRITEQISPMKILMREIICRWNMPDQEQVDSNQDIISFNNYDIFAKPPQLDTKEEILFKETFHGETSFVSTIEFTLEHFFKNRYGNGFISRDFEAVMEELALNAKEASGGKPVEFKLIFYPSDDSKSFGTLKAVFKQKSSYKKRWDKLINTYAKLKQFGFDYFTKSTSSAVRRKDKTVTSGGAGLLQAASVMQHYSNFPILLKFLRGKKQPHAVTTEFQITLPSKNYIYGKNGRIRILSSTLSSRDKSQIGKALCDADFFRQQQAWLHMMRNAGVMLRSYSAGETGLSSAVNRMAHDVEKQDPIIAVSVIKTDQTTEQETLEFEIVFTHRISGQKGIILFKNRDDIELIPDVRKVMKDRYDHIPYLEISVSGQITKTGIKQQELILQAI